MTAGPLTGIKVLELGGIGPGPFAAMVLADMGAEVIRIERVGQAFRLDNALPTVYNIYNRGRRSLCLNLRAEEARNVVWRLIERSDVLIEGFRPGVAERLGFDPDQCLERNSRLIYGRMTGWGQDGPLAQAAGHDINYIALTGALDAIGQKDGPPIPPHNLVGDHGGGGMFLAYGIACALVERATSGKGQVIDAAIVDGTATLMAFNHGLLAAGQWSHEREGNFLDGGRPWYSVYQTSDGRYVSIGALEPQFYAELLKRTGLADSPDLPDRDDPERWDELRERFAAVFKTKTRDEWTELLERTETCFAPVLTLEEATAHRHARQRGTYVELGGVMQPAPSPRFSRTSPTLTVPPPERGQDTDAILGELGFDVDSIRALRGQGAVA